MQQSKRLQLYEKYRIESQIGRGASGTCYRVQHLQTKQTCALKKIHISSIKKYSTKEACSEVAILSRLSHPHIIKLLEFFSDESHLYIVMQYAPKGDLHNILKRRRIKKQNFSQKQIWQMARQLLTALEYLHSQKIIHRDVKTLNIFMDSAGQLYLGDLGVSKILKNDGGLYSRVGTPLYLAPEIIKYEKYDYKADIWGLGCVCYQLAAMSHPFEGKNIITLGQNIVGSQPKNIDSYSSQLNSFIVDMLEKNPYKRMGAAQLLKKYFSNMEPILMPSPAPEVESQQVTNKIIPREQKSSVLLKSNQIRRKFVNNFLQQKLEFKEQDKFPQEQIQQPSKKQIKSVIFKEHIPRPSQKSEKQHDKSMQETLVFTRRIVKGQSKKYVEATHKTYFAMSSCDQQNKAQGQESKQVKAPVAIRSRTEQKSAILQPKRQIISSMGAFCSDKKMPVINSSIINSKSTHKTFFAPTYSSFERNQNHKKTEIQYSDLNRLSSENQIQGPVKISRIRPKSSIMTKQRHQSAMKSIKKSVRRFEPEDLEHLIETKILKKPEMIIL